jgi:DNA-binding MarR family transcriptional regulator
MLQKRSQEKWQSPSQFGPCACSQLRRTARRVSSLYDEALEACGLTVTQYAILANVGRAQEVSRTVLAAQLGMDRTTLTRNLQPLEKAKLVIAAASADRRERLLCLSAEGRRKLRQSYGLWEKTQQRFAEKLGADALEQLRSALQAAETAAEAVMSEAWQV